MSVSDIRPYRREHFNKIKRIRRFLRSSFLLYLIGYFMINYKAYGSAEIERALYYLVNSNYSTSIPISRTNTTVLEPYSNGIVMADKDVLSYISIAGEIDSEITLAYVSPAVTVGYSTSIAYDRNGYIYRITDDYGSRDDRTLMSKIINIHANKKDQYVVITDEVGYVSAFTFYDKNSNEILKWSTSKYNIIGAKASDNGNFIVATCVSQDNLQFISSILVFDTKTGDIISQTNFVDKFPLDIEIFDNSNFAIIFSDHIRISNPYGNTIFDSGSVSLSAYNTDSGHNIAYAENSFGGSTVVNLINQNGKLLSSNTFAQKVDSYAISDSNIYILSNFRVYKYTYNFKLVDETEQLSGILDLIIQNDNSVYGVFYNKLERLFLN